jgi:hypothetical protein
MTHALNDMEKFSVCVSTPTLRATLTANYVQSVTALQASCHSKGFGFDIKLVSGISSIDHARNYLVSLFLERTDCSHLFFVDDDMGFEVDEVIRMFEWANSADVVGVMCPKRAFNWSRVKRSCWRTRTSILRILLILAVATKACFLCLTMRQPSMSDESQPRSTRLARGS